MIEEAAKTGAAQPEARSKSGPERAGRRTPPDEVPAPDRTDAPRAKNRRAAGASREMPLHSRCAMKSCMARCCGFSALGIARVDSHLVLSERVRKEIDEIFGAEDAAARSCTRVGFFGGGTTTFTSRGPHDQARTDKSEITLRTTFKLAIGYSAQRRQVRHGRQMAEVRSQRANHGDNVAIRHDGHDASTATANACAAICTTATSISASTS